MCDMETTTNREGNMFTAYYTDSYKAAKTAKAAGHLVTLSAHGWKIESK